MGAQLMARRVRPNIFGSIMDGTADAEPPAQLRMPDPARPASVPVPSAALAQAENKSTAIPAAFHRGPVAALENDLRQSMSQTLRDIDTALIDPSPFSDRIAISEEDIQDLRDSIERSGLRVPILLRPNPEKQGRFIIVYGRRRLAALKSLGMPARAMIRDMSDVDSILAQGQENNARLDPSFIEKALFAASLEAAGYESRVVMEALNVNKAYLSHMRRVVTNIPANVIYQIGSAHGVGWKKWHEAVDLVLKDGVDPAIPEGLFDHDTNKDTHFLLWLNHLRRSAARKLPVSQSSDNNRERRARPVFTSDGKTRIGEVRRNGGAVHLCADPRETEFTRWLDAKGEELLARLYGEWVEADRG